MFVYCSIQIQVWKKHERIVIAKAREKNTVEIDNEQKKVWMWHWERLYIYFVKTAISIICVQSIFNTYLQISTPHHLFSRALLSPHHIVNISLSIRFHIEHFFYQTEKENAATIDDKPFFEAIFYFLLPLSFSLCSVPVTSLSFVCVSSYNF